MEAALQRTSERGRERSHYVSTADDRNQPTPLLGDFKVAHDSINHAELRKTMDENDLSGKLIRLIKATLDGVQISDEHFIQTLSHSNFDGNDDRC